MDTSADYRNLTDSEISTMEAAGCHCDEWNRSEYQADLVRLTATMSFFGDIKLENSPKHLLTNRVCLHTADIKCPPS